MSWLECVLSSTDAVTGVVMAGINAKIIIVDMSVVKYLFFVFTFFPIFHVAP